jgi:hypothetical protein
MAWYVVRFNSNSEPFVEEQFSDDHEFDPIESKVGESRFNDEMMQEHPALVEALEAWKTGDQSREAHGMAEDHLFMWADDLKNMVPEFDSPELVSRYEDRDPLCKKAMRVRALMAEARRLLSFLPDQYPSFEVPDWFSNKARRKWEEDRDLLQSASVNS